MHTQIEKERFHVHAYRCRHTENVTDEIYRRIYYRETCENAPGYAFEYSINFVMEEGAISYCNLDGGLTTRGARISSRDLSHFKLLLDNGKPEQYREGLEKVNVWLKMKEVWWELIVDYLDGTPELRLNNYDEDTLKSDEVYQTPNFIQELRAYAVLKLGLEDLRGRKER